MRKRLILGASAGLAGFALLTASAQAHVSFHPNVLPAGANATLDIRVPNEMDNANTKKLAVQVPPGFIDISTEPIPGWTTEVKTRKLATPVQTDNGPVTEEVSQITWTGSGSGKIPPGGFLNFPISTADPGSGRACPDVQGAADLRQREGRALDRVTELGHSGPVDRRHGSERRDPGRRRRRGRATGDRSAALLVERKLLVE